MSPHDGFRLSGVAAATSSASASTVKCEGYYACAASHGFNRDQADAALREAQGDAAGSSPTTEDLQAALQILTA